MSSLGNALHQLREERKEAQQQIKKLDSAISAIEAVVGRNGSEAIRNPSHLTRVVSAASRGRMARAQRVRRKGERQASRTAVKKTNGQPAKRTMSLAARRKIAAFQKARWAKIKAQQKKAA